MPGKNRNPCLLNSTKMFGRLNVSFLFARVQRKSPHQRVEMFWVTGQDFVIKRKETHESVGTPFRGLLDTTHANAVATITVETKFIVTFITTGVYAALRTGKAIGYDA